MQATASSPGPAGPAGEDALSNVRPLSVGDILDLALRLYRRHFRVLFLTMLGLQIPIFVVQRIPELITRAYFPAASDPQLLLLLPPEEMIVGVGVLVGVNVFAMVSLTILAALASGALILGGERAWRGEAPTPADCYAKMWRRAPALAGTQLLTVLLLFLAVFAAALPGAVLLGVGAATTSLAPVVLGALVAVTGILVVTFVLYLRWFLVVPVVALDGVSGFAALSRSAELMAGSVGPGFMGRVKVRASLVLLVVFFIIIVPSLMIGIPKLVLAASYSSTEVLDVGAIPLLIRLPIESAELLLGALLTPFSAMAILLVYLDLRIRKEGYDLELRALALGTPASDAPVVAATAIPATALSAPPVAEPGEPKA
jgi:hypothetical protein